MQGIDIFDMRPLDASRKGMLAWFLCRAPPLRDIATWCVSSPGSCG